MKMIVAGESSVGKTNVLLRFTDDTFKQDSKSTVGVSISSLRVQILNKAVKINLYDSGGLEKYRAITRPYFKFAHGAAVVYDTTDRPSFLKTQLWINELTQINPSIKILILGNKIDRWGHKRVATEEGIKLALNNRAFFMEVTAKSDPKKRINEGFNTLLEDIVRKMINESASKHTIEEVRVEDTDGEIDGMDNRWLRCCY